MAPEQSPAPSSGDQVPDLIPRPNRVRVMPSVEYRPMNGVERRTTEFWCVGDAKIVEECPNGRYCIVDWFMLDMDGLRRVHAVLGHVLSYLATADPLVDDQPEF